jgi:hypothetical protein
LGGLLAFQVRPALIACDDVVKTDLLHPAREELVVFYDPHPPQVVCQLV